MSQADLQKYTGNPCASANISWALWNETAGQTNPRSRPNWDASLLCNASNYGTWSTPPQLEDHLSILRYQQKLNASGISLAGSFKGKDGNQYLVFRKGSAFIGFNAGVVGTGGSSVLTNNGGTLVNTNGSNVVSQGGGNFVPVATVVSQGGGNLLSSDSAGVVSQGGGNVVSQGGGNLVRIQLAVGDTLFTFPNRYVVVSGPKQQQASPPSTSPGQKPNPSDQETAQWRQRGPCSDPWVSKAVTEYRGKVNGYANQGECNNGLYNGGRWNNYDELYRAVVKALSSQSTPAPPARSDDAILLCLSTTVNGIRGRDNGANHISLTASGGTAYFSGNVLTQAYKDQLTSAAQSCGARAVNTNNLRVGR